MREELEYFDVHPTEVNMRWDGPDRERLGIERLELRVPSAQPQVEVALVRRQLQLVEYVRMRVDRHRVPGSVAGEVAVATLFSPDSRLALRYGLSTLLTSGPAVGAILNRDNVRCEHW